MDRPLGGILLHGQAQLLQTMGRFVEVAPGQHMSKPGCFDVGCPAPGVLGEETEGTLHARWSQRLRGVLRSES